MIRRLVRGLRAFVYGGTSSRAVRTYKTARRTYESGPKWLAMVFFRRLQRQYGIFISPHAEIGRDIKFPHPNGIVIGEGVKIGERVTIYQQVTLGGARIGDWKLGNYPTVGSNTVIFAGAKIIGAIAIGNDCIIGANAVVTKDVPAFHTAVGIPAIAHPNRETANAI